MPSLELLIAVLKELVPTELRFVDAGVGDLDVRLQVFASAGPDYTGSWTLHFGDPSYDQDHRGYWGAGTCTRDMTDSDYAILDQDLIDQAEESRQAP
jgi:hypothetical protein